MSDDFKYALQDYEKIRDELYEILVDAKDALRLAKAILEESEHPRAVEVYSGLLKNVATIQSQILDLTKTYKEIITSKNHNETQQLSGEVTNNNLFVGTTQGMQEMLLQAGLIDRGTINVTPKEIIADE